VGAAGAMVGTAAMMGVTLAVTIAAFVVGLVLRVRQVVVMMEGGIALRIRVTAVLEVVAVASTILEAQATAVIAVV